ncbi:MAG TPA: hypothetical protein VFG42_10740 [Baekduia sp.]|uniref:hypothetical protein n=1 Tax=Baekduia sp. TaxID=2600305 RepID=UPI002D76FC43|nr:hypothetical protein [Baekduia sp.]HET6507257.1 hypothetical protein [Baekduia sp.]
MASQEPPPRREGLDVATLFISAIASAAAAYVTSKIWAPGTLFSAAMTPVIVALVKEGLRRPTEVITNVVPTASRWTRAGADDAGLVADVEPGQAPPDEAPAPVLVPGDHGPVRVYSTRGRRLRWRLAVITGLLGFGIAVLAFTVPELIAGQSLGGSNKTTIFGGGGHRHRTSTTKSTTTKTSTQKTTTSTTPTTPRTVTQTETVTTPTPTPTTPAQTTPAPSSAAPQSSTAPSNEQGDAAAPPVG